MSSYHKLAQEAVDAYITVRGLNYVSSGICNAVNNRTTYQVDDYINSMQERAYATWPYFTGDSSFPVPYNITTLPTDSACDDGQDAYYDYELGYNHRWTGDYGDARSNLLDHLIKFYTARAKEYNDN